MKKGLLLTLGSVVSLVIIFKLMKTKEEPAVSPVKTKSVKTTQSTKTGEVESATIHKIKKVKRPDKIAPSPVKTASTTHKQVLQKKRKRNLIYDPSKALSLQNHPYMVSVDDPDPRIQSIVEAHRNGTHPERLSVNVRPRPFDKSAWDSQKSYRNSYMNTAEPGRALMEPVLGQDTSSIGQMSVSKAILKTGELSTVTVKAADGYPVNFYSPQGGIFTESRLNSVTVIAEGGIAEVTWYAMPGTLGNASIIASSPVSAGRTVSFIKIQNNNPQGKK